MPNYLRAKKAEKDGVSERDLIPREIRMFNYSSGGSDEAYDPSSMKHTQTPRYAMICKWIEQHHSNTSWNDQNAEIWKKKMCVLTWYGGLPQILTASATLIDLIVQSFLDNSFLFLWITILGAQQLQHTPGVENHSYNVTAFLNCPAYNF